MVAGIVQHDLSCLGCGYNLRTLADDGRCPECGRFVRDSLRLHGLLRNSDPDWLLRLHDGLGLIWRSVIAIVGTVVLTAGLLLALIAIQPRFSVVAHESILQAILSSAGVIVFLIAPFMTARGLWQIFQSEPSRPVQQTRLMDAALPLALGGPVAMVGGALVCVKALFGQSGAHATLTGGTLIVCVIIVWLLVVVFVAHLQNIEARCEHTLFTRRRQWRTARLGTHVKGGAAVLSTVLVLALIRWSIVPPSTQVMRLMAIPFALVVLWSFLVLLLSRGSRRLLEHELHTCEALHDDEP